MARSQLRQALAKLSDEELWRLSPLTPKVKTGLELYCPHKPFAKQQAFLDLTCREALYGGGAGPGKTEALLMAALMYAHVPGYSALILRRDYPRLALPNSIMDRARQWLYRSEAVWNAQTKAYRFPSGAVLQFGYIDNPDDRYRYASSEYQFIGWDELTEFRLGPGDDNPYEFMFSRLRKPSKMSVPLRMRAASNPGNIGHQYVRQRFVTDEALAALRDDRPRVFYADHQGRDRAFVPALLADNPHLDKQEYMGNLMHLPSVTRAGCCRATGRSSRMRSSRPSGCGTTISTTRSHSAEPAPRAVGTGDRQPAVPSPGHGRYGRHLETEGRRAPRPRCQLVGVRDLGLLARPQVPVPAARVARTGQLGRTQGRRAAHPVAVAAADDAHRECPPWPTTGTGTAGGSSACSWSIR